MDGGRADDQVDNPSSRSGGVGSKEVGPHRSDTLARHNDFDEGHPHPHASMYDAPVSASRRSTRSSYSSVDDDDGQEELLRDLANDEKTPTLKYDQKSLQRAASDDTVYTESSAVLDTLTKDQPGVYFGTLPSDGISEEYPRNPFADEKHVYGSIKSSTRTSTELSIPKDRIIRQGNKVNILFLTAFAASVPIVLGAIFFASLGLGAPSGYHEDGYFIRPQDEGISLYIGTELLNPLLIASVTTTVISAIAPTVLGLVAFHFGHQWIKASGLDRSAGRNSHLPTPYQHSLLLGMGSTATELSLFSFLHYWLFRTPSRRPNIVQRRTRAQIPFVLFLGAGALSVVLALSYAIKVVDIVLHKDLESTVMSRPDRNTSIDMGFGLATACINDTTPGCPVATRAIEAFQAAQNLSDVFRAYPMGNVSNPALDSSEGDRTSSVDQFSNMAIIAAPPSTETRWNYRAKTLAVAATCTARRPVCNVESQEVQACWPANAPREDFFYATVQDKPLTPDIQLFLAPGADNGAKDGDHVGGTATAVSPRHLLGWACFPSYGNVAYSDTELNYTLVNWWMIGQGIAPNVLLCSMLACDIGIYSGEYTSTNGTLAVLPGTFERADNATVLTVTDTLPYPTYPDTSANGSYYLDSMIYRYTAKWMDAQLQTAVTAAGNMLGNDTVQFQNQIAQSISNLLLSWTAGSIEQGPSLDATFEDAVLAVKIPLAWSYIFTLALFLYALLIIGLGVSCLFIPTAYSVTDKVVQKHDVKYRVAVPQVDIARLRFVDISTIVHELVPPDGHSSRLATDEMFDERGGRGMSRTETMHSVITSDSMPDCEGRNDGVLIRRRKTRAEKELKTVIVENESTGELNLKIEGR